MLIQQYNKALNGMKDGFTTNKENAF